MSATPKTKAKADDSSRGLLARPLDALVFLLPLMVLYEASSFRNPERVIAFDLLQRFFELFGHVGVWLPGIMVVTILLATHIVSGEPWKIHWGRVGWMYVEGVLLAAPLLLLNWTMPLTAGAPPPSTFDRLAMGIGAGIYEELVFRLVLISIIVVVGADVLRLDRGGVAVAAVAISSIAFAAHHHQPIGREPFDLALFTFRAMAGAYLAIIFWYRGYGLAAGCHAAYNVALSLVDPSAL